MDQLPAYEAPTLPIYSPATAGPSRLSSRTDSTYSSLHTSDHTYKSDHLLVNLGPRRWGTRLPAYGYHGVLDGTVKVRKACSHVISVTATLEGNISLTTTESGRAAATISGASETKILSQSTVLFQSESQKTAVSLKGEEYSLSLPFPTYVTGGESQLPPSYAICHSGAFCDVKYSLRVDIVRKGLRRHERLTIPILYLPQTRPSLPPLLDLAPQYSVENSLDNDRVATTNLSLMKAAVEYLHESTVQLAMPSPKCFAAGEWIPLTMTVSCTKNPTLPHLLINNQCITIDAVRRSKIWTGSTWNTRETVVSSAEVQHLDTSHEGVCKSHWTLQAGKPQRHASWQIPGVLGVSYFIRVTITPPYPTAQKLTALRHQEPIRITSESWIDPVLAEATIDYPALGLTTSPATVAGFPAPRL